MIGLFGPNGYNGVTPNGYVPPPLMAGPNGVGGLPIPQIPGDATTGLPPGPNGQTLPIQPRPVDPGVFGLPGFHSGAGLPIPIPSTTDTPPAFPGLPGGIHEPGLLPAQSVHAAQAQNPIEHVIARLGIHPQSGLAQAFRAIHTVLAHHLASQAAHMHVPVGRPGGPVRPGPTLQ